MNDFWLKLRRYQGWAAPAALLLILVVYGLTLARAPVLGDPSEYTVVAHILGIAHPPGYAFITVVGKLFQTLIPLGTIAWRMHFLAAVTGTAAAAAIYGTVRNLAPLTGRSGRGPALAGALFAALSSAFAADIWQHSIHANPHIMTAAFLVVNIFLLTRWGSPPRRGATGGHTTKPRQTKPGSRLSRPQTETRSGGQSPYPPLTPPKGRGIRISPPPGGKKGGQSANRIKTNTDTSDNKWLYLFCLSAGLGLSHHPLTVFSFPAYTLYILSLRPGIWREGRALLKMVAFALLGLSVWLYFPIRSPMEPALGPSTMNTLDGFLNHVLARGLTESLPFFGLADQWSRAIVFFSLLRLQYGLATIALALMGLGWLGTRPALRRPLLLIGLAFLSNYLFVINLRQQDIMAYLLGPFMLLGLLAGIGLWGLLAAARARLRLKGAQLALLAAALFLLGPALQLARNAAPISLRDYRQGADYADAVFDFFGGRGEGAVLLSNWEHQTVLWYRGFVEGEWPDEADVRLEWVSTGSRDPWVEAVYNYLPGGPVYLYDYRPEIVAAGFRLRPRGPFYQVVEPEDATLPPELTPLDQPAGALAWRGYRLPAEPVSAGAFIAVDLAFSAPAGTADYYIPIVQVGDISYAFTTDSHLITPLWTPGEVIVERFDFALPLDLAAGSYPVAVQLKNLSTDSLAGPLIPLGDLEVVAGDRPVPANGWPPPLLANYRQRVGLTAATARAGFARRGAPWPAENPLPVAPGDTVDVTLHWLSLAPAEDSYTIFVHLIDGANQAVSGVDYTPLGGAAPTHLWIPKWLPGQQLTDPYRIEVPEGLPAGTYWLEAGLYEMTALRRLHRADEAGNLVGDRFILGAVVVR